MNAELAKLRPAQVAPRAHIVARTEAAALADLRRRQARGGISSAGPARRVTEGPWAGRYSIEVRLLPERRDPRWARLCVRAGAGLLGVAAVLGSMAWLLSAMTGAALATVCLVAGAALALRVRLAHGRREVVVTTAVRVR